MKVIIQNIVAKEFLAADGRWVATKDGAKDFFTLLRAYHFAQANTSVPFRVLLHCPDDGYSTSIVEGVGAATDESRAEKPVPVTIHYQVERRFERPASGLKGFDVSRIHLN